MRRAGHEARSETSDRPRPHSSTARASHSSDAEVAPRATKVSNDIARRRRETTVLRTTLID
eukprot:scaffold17189_cov28-Tisochrysis_lutea.AAC.6